MKLHGNITINNRRYAKGEDISWLKIYPFFLVHMLMFGGMGFLMAYGSKVSALLLYIHGGFAILVYIIFYLTIFGRDEVKWMFINAALAAAGIYSQIGWILALFGKEMDEYPFYVHLIPFLYFVLYTFLLRQMVLDITASRDNPARRRWVENGYIAGSVLFYLTTSLA